jgi:RNA polymerase sigma factor (sigma-70 family)
MKFILQEAYQVLCSAFFPLRGISTQSVSSPEIVLATLIGYNGYILNHRMMQRKEMRYHKMLYERFYGYALKIAFRYVDRYDTAKDVVNDGFVKLFRQIDQFSNKGKVFPEQLLVAWLKQIIVNASVQELLRNKMNTKTEDIPENVWEETDDSEKADQALLYKELISHLKNLPPVYRIVFNMFVIDGFTHFYISSRLGISEDVSRFNLSCARNILKKTLSKEEDLKLAGFK